MSTERQIVDGQSRAIHDDIFGDLEANIKWTKPELLQDEFLTTGWDQTTRDEGVIEELSKGVNGAAWTSQTIFGFEEIAGKRYQTRRILFRSGEEERRVRLVYRQG